MNLIQTVESFWKKSEILRRKRNSPEDCNRENLSVSSLCPEEFRLKTNQLLSEFHACQLALKILYLPAPVIL